MSEYDDVSCGGNIAIKRKLIVSGKDMRGEGKKNSSQAHLYAHAFLLSYVSTFTGLRAYLGNSTPRNSVRWGEGGEGGEGGEVERGWEDGENSSQAARTSTNLV